MIYNISIDGTNLAPMNKSFGSKDRGVNVAENSK